LRIEDVQEFLQVAKVVRRSSLNGVTGMDMDLSVDNLRKIVAALLATFEKIHSDKKPFRPPSVSELVPAKQIDENRQLVRIVLRDAVISRLLTKCARTFKAIVCLLDNGYQADAFTLSRVLVENALVTQWLLCDDKQISAKRIDTYVLHYEVVKVRADAVDAAELNPAEPPSVWATERSKEISQLLFQDRWMFWAQFPDEATKKLRVVKLREMAKEMGLEHLYDRYYFQMSQHIHSAPGSVLDDKVPEAHFSVDTSSPGEWEKSVLTIVVAFGWCVTSVVDINCGLGIHEELKDIQFRFLGFNDEEREALMAVYRANVSAQK